MAFSDSPAMEHWKMSCKDANFNCHEENLLERVHMREFK